MNMTKIIPYGIADTEKTPVRSDCGYARSEKQLNGVRLRKGLVAAMLLMPVMALAGTLGQALNCTSLNWTTGGIRSRSDENVNWTYCSDDSYYDGACATSGAGGAGDAISWLKTTVTGPCKISFRYKVQTYYGSFNVYCDSSTLYNYTGETGTSVPWQYAEYDIGYGSHEIKFEYHHPGMGYAYKFNGARVDNFTVTPTSSTGGGSSGSSSSVLASALDVSGLTFTTGGNAGWYSQSSTTHDGYDAVRSGSIGDDESSWMQTTVSGPKQISFWWKVSSESGYDYLRFYVDGAEKEYTSGTGGSWAQKTVQVTGSGTHTLKWQYSKDYSCSNGDDCGWVDQLVVSDIPGSTGGGSSGTLGQALNCTSLNWTTGGTPSCSGENVNWSYCSDDSYSDGACASSGAGGAGDAISWLKTTVTGPCKISFRYKVQTYTGSFNVYCDSSTLYNYTGVTGTSVPWQYAEYDIGYGSHEIKFEYHHPGIGYAYKFNGARVDNFTVTPTSSTGGGSYGTLGQALNCTSLNWTTGGTPSCSGENVNWSYCSDDSYSDGACASSGAGGAGDAISWLKTTVTGPCKISFRYKVQTYTGSFNVYCDSSTLYNYTGVTGTSVSWQYAEYNIGSGSHEIKFEYHHPGMGYAYRFNGVRIDNFTISTVVTADFDGDGRYDAAYFNGDNEGSWFIHSSVRGDHNVDSFNVDGCIPIPADYDGDRIDDLSVYDQLTGDWWIQYSSGGWTRDNFGSGSCIPYPADYDGDGKADLSVYDQVTGDWFIRYSSGGWVKDNFGSLTCLPVPADYDGDGRADLSVRDQATGDWFIRYSSGGWYGDHFGSPSCDPYPGDYDGDGKADLSVYDQVTGDWFVRFSSGGWTMDNFGSLSCVPVPADYDGDGRDDFAVFDQNTGDRWIRYSSGGWDCWHR